MTTAQSTLKELIQIANDGATFYADAAQQVDHPQVRDLFTRMAGHKQTLAHTLGRTLTAMGEIPPPGGTVSGTLRKAYAEVKALFSGKDVEVYVAQLEATEDRLLHQFEAALQDPENVSVHATLRAQLPQVRACHDEMRNWKQRLAA